jgi:L-amino acid N-acyltransferase YncA
MGVPGASAVHVRGSLEADMRAVTEIYREQVAHGLATFETIPPDLDEMTRRRAAILAAKLPYLVAEQDGIVTGFAYAAPYRERAAYQLTVEDSVYVASGQRGSGIGRLLLSTLIENCSESGYRQMVAVIGDSANAASIGLHARLGFRVGGVLPSVGFKLGRWVDTVLMSRPLGDGDRTKPQINAD